MMTAEQSRAEMRVNLDALVAHFCERGCKRMQAYRRVSGEIGRAPSWIQRLLSRDDDATVEWHDGWNIRAAYERLCARIDAASDAIEADTLKRREVRHAARASAAAAGARDPRLAPGVADVADVTERSR